MNARSRPSLHPVCVGTVLLLMAVTANAEVPVLKLQVKSAVALTEALPVSVVVSNTTKAALTIEDPRASTHATVHLVDVETHEDHSFSMGQPSTTDRGHGEWAMVMPVVKPVTLPAGDSLQVRADANERLFLHPGTFDVFFSLKDVQSNRVRVTVRFTRESLERLITLAADANASYARREWAVELIKRVKKDFSLSLPLPDAKERELLEAANRVAVKSLRQWVSSRPAAELAEQLATITR